MFKLSDINFMTNNMKIDVAHLEFKLNDPNIITSRTDIVDAIEKFIEAIKEFEASGEKRNLYTCEDNFAENIINSHANTLSKKIKNDNALQVLGAISNAFRCYAYNGLHQLYTRQENEGWYPKITLTETLSPNDISSLDAKVKLYRGCDVNEYNKQVYGQAWTTSLQVAKDFAYKHYKHYNWFNAERRVVLRTIYSRDNVLFSHQNIEFEVVINVNMLGNVSKYT